MGSTDDEQHPETTQQQLSSDNTTSTHSNNAPRLTPMPHWLMHWWTPLAIAEGLLRWTLIVAIFWGGQPHWPSSEAMKLCVTIVGAGLAFSAWQQRSHDNAVRDDDKLDRERAADRARTEREEQRSLEETRRLEQIERDEYWKRREQIYQLLGSKNPGLRLGAVALLAELADSAAHSTLLNKNAEQQLQRHIIDTLCLQLRHEGLAHETEGSLEEHSSIQEDIFYQLVKRIINQEPHSPQADWRTHDIDLSHTIFHFPITLTNLEIRQNIDISHSRFLESFTLTGCRLFNLSWSCTTFERSLQVRASELYIDHFPLEIQNGKFKETVLNTHQTSPIPFNLSAPKGKGTATNKIRFTDECKFPKGLHIQTNGSFDYFSSEYIEFINSSFQSISICGQNFNAIVQFSYCKFFEATHIHDIDYQLGSVLTPDLEAVEAYFSRASEDGSEVAVWEAEFPDHPFDQTAGISFRFCTFSTVNSNNMIIAHKVQAIMKSGIAPPSPLSHSKTTPQTMESMLNYPIATKKQITEQVKMHTSNKAPIPFTTIQRPSLFITSNCYAGSNHFP